MTTAQTVLLHAALGYLGLCIGVYVGASMVVFAFSRNGFSIKDRRRAPGGTIRCPLRNPDARAVSGLREARDSESCWEIDVAFGFAGRGGLERSFDLTDIVAEVVADEVRTVGCRAYLYDVTPGSGLFRVSTVPLRDHAHLVGVFDPVGADA